MDDVGIIFFSLMIAVFIMLSIEPLLSKDDEDDSEMDQQMELEVFKTYREFFQKYPSRMYLCSCCGYMTNNRFNCPRCGYRADGLLKTMEKGLRYRIESLNREEEIFKPVELEKGK